MRDLGASPSRGSVYAGGELRAWWAALARRYTYRPSNPHAWFGLLWGLPIPVVGVWIHTAAMGRPFEAAAVTEWLAQSPAGWLLLFHPPLFYVVFGAIGTLAHDRAERIGALVDRLSYLAYVDGLTGLRNHRAFEEALAAADPHQPLGLLLIDVDHFKEFNDTYGHPAGDEALRALALRLQQLVRTSDVVFRYGGEEIAVLLPGADPDTMEAIAGRVCSGVGGAPLRIGPSRESSLTISVGAAHRLPGETCAQLVERCDQRLYAAKRAGRNQVVCRG